MGATTVSETRTMLTLPGDAVRQIQWRFADRFDLQMLVLVFGYTRHPAWDETEHKNCFLASELEGLESTMPGIMAMGLDVLEEDGSHPQKAGPCAGCAGSSEFLRLQSRLTMCLTGSRLAKDRAADTVSKVMIPEALDYPAAGPA